MKLYALLIGINEYSPASKPIIRGLDACINDVNAIRDFLLEHYSDVIADRLQILTLLNEQANRENVINGFRKHLAQAGREDVALLFYSGHGSYGTTAVAFQASTTDQHEQTWVLYDSREEGKYDLADKEIALLLEEISLRKPHVVVIADSCHSGSVTKEIEEFIQLQPRFTSGIWVPRPLESYLDGAYLSRPNLTVPSSNHLLLAACERTERAWETNRQGQFTKSLLAVLRKSGGQVRYSDLFIQVRATLKSILRNQTPQLETIGHFNPKQGFLGRQVEGGALHRYRVHFENGTWNIDFGAAMGIEPDAGALIEITLFYAPFGGDPFATVPISYLNVTSSTLGSATSALDTSRVYWGEPATLPLIPFLVHADAKATAVMQDALDDAAQSGIILTENPAASRYSVAIEENTILLFDTSARTMIQGVRGTGQESVWEALNILQKIARWSRLLVLQNHKSRMQEAEVECKIRITLDTLTHDFPGPQITLEHDDLEIPFEVIFTNKSQKKRYVTLLYLSPHYGVEVFFNDSQPVAANASVTLRADVFTLDGDEEIDTLKLIVSTAPVDGYLFSQEVLVPGTINDPYPYKGIGTARAIGAARTIGSTRSDWYTKTISIRQVRKGDQVVGPQAIPIGNDIIIESHPAFRARLNWAPLIPRTRSAGEAVIQDNYFADNPYFQVVNVPGQTREVADQRIMEAGSIQQPESLKTQPLVISLPPAGNDELVLPFFFDGEDLLPAGPASVDAGERLHVAISHLPPETGTNQTRSVGSAFRMLFIKFSRKLGVAWESQQLAWVDYGSDAIRRTDDVSQKIATAQKVLLLLHGIIGDTEGMAKTFRMAERHGYDLVLTYDYENLNTTIEANAEILADRLRAEGFGPGDGKELVLVAHSMGGLVARYLIEHLDGAAFIDRLVMAGTPNGGSRFGNIPDYLNWSAVVLGLGVKLFPPQLGAVAGFLSTVLKTANQVLLPSLQQMDATSPFIRLLAKGARGPVPYHVLGGDLEAYLLAQASLPLLEKIVTQIGGWVYRNVQNDIAVSTESIFAVPGATTQYLPCHHLNYFATAAAVLALEEAIR